MGFKNNKIIIIGSFTSPIYSSAFFQALNDNDYTVNKIDTSFLEKNFFSKLGIVFPTIFNPLIFVKNIFFIYKLIKFVKYDLFFFWSPIDIHPFNFYILKFLKKKIYIYNNDNPYIKKSFKDIRNYFKWRWFYKSLSYSSLTLCYRPKDLINSKEFGSKSVKLSMPYFIPSRDYPHPYQLKKKYDVTFVGHFENDIRFEYLKYAAEKGLKVKIYGNNIHNPWITKGYRHKNLSISGLIDIQKYRKTVSLSLVMACFLSKKNKDVYTRRTFEIPAMKGILLSERTQEQKKIYIENKEALYFSSKEEFVKKIFWVKENPLRAKSIVDNAYTKTINFHSIYHRINDLF